MVGQINHHLYRKRGFYYFCRRVPKALLEHYPKPRIVVALKTRQFRDAFRQSQIISKRLDDQWFHMQLDTMGLDNAQSKLFQSVHVLDAELPYINVCPHPWRRLKTKGSERLVPLVGASLWVAKRLQQHDSSYAFPRYCDGKICNANSASAALNKWLKPRVNEDAVVHSLRHSMRDRLRAVEWPSEMIDQIDGWSKRSVGERYEEGHSVVQLRG